MDHNSNCNKQYTDNKISVCDCCTESLIKVIQHEFWKGDIIGLTYIEQGVASIAYGTFIRLIGSVVEIDEFLLPGTTSFVPLCKVDSIEKGITPDQAGSKGPLSVSLIK